MTVDLEHRKVNDFERTVNELSDTGEQLRIDHRVPTQEEIDKLVHSAESLLRFANRRDIRAAMATGALASVIRDPRIEKAYAQLRDAALPIDAPELTRVDREINEISRKELDRAIEMTNGETSFAEALVLAGRISDEDTDVLKLVPQKERDTHETPLTYDELLERVYVPPRELPEPEGYDSYGNKLFGADPEIVARTKAKMEAIKATKDEAA